VALDPIYFLQTSVFLNFTMTKDGLLIYEENLRTLNSISNIIIYLSIISLVILGISLWFHKMAGL
jgi:hypothetical protein